MTTTPEERQPAHIVLVDRLLRACESAIRPFLPEEDFEGVLRQARLERVLWITDLIARVAIPPNAVAEVRRRIEAIRDSLNGNADAKHSFGNEIRFMVSDLELLIATLPRQEDAARTAM